MQSYIDYNDTVSSYGKVITDSLDIYFEGKHHSTHVALNSIIYYKKENICKFHFNLIFKLHSQFKNDYSKHHPQKVLYQFSSIIYKHAKIT